MGAAAPRGPRLALTLVLDTGVVLRSCQRDSGFLRFGEQSLHAPRLLWSEFRSSVHAGVWRGELGSAQAYELRRRLRGAPVAPHDHELLDDEAWAVADELGWAKTYDAEFVGLARLLGCRLVTLDARLRRGADRLGFVVTPGEL